MASRKGKANLSTVDHQKIALGKATGKTNRQIAADVGVSTSSVDHLAGSPEHKALVARLQEKHGAKLEELYTEIIDSTRADLKGGTAADRLNARSQGMSIVTAADRLNAPAIGLGGNEMPGGGYFLEELLYAKSSRPAGRGTNER